MNPTGIMERVKTKLKESSYLAYVNQIEIGAREGAYPETNKYNIFLEPKTNDETDADYSWPKVQPKFTISILGYCNVKDVTRQVVGEGNIKGILDFEEDIKKALGPEKQSADVLGCNAINFWFGATGYDFSAWPVRGFELELIIQYRQDFITRD